MTSRSEKLRQRAVALGLIRDTGPLTPEEEERTRGPYLTEDEICDMLEEMLNAHEA